MEQGLCLYFSPLGLEVSLWRAAMISRPVPMGSGEVAVEVYSLPCLGYFINLGDGLMSVCLTSDQVSLSKKSCLYWQILLWLLSHLSPRFPTEIAALYP